MKTLGHDFGTTPMGWHQIAAVHAARGSEAMAGRGDDVDGRGGCPSGLTGASQLCVHETRPSPDSVPLWGRWTCPDCGREFIADEPAPQMLVMWMPAEDWTLLPVIPR